VSGSVVTPEKSTQDVPVDDRDEIVTGEFALCGPNVGLVVELRTGDRRSSPTRGSLGNRVTATRTRPGYPVVDGMQEHR
jgi:hypothetical protein